MLISQGHEAGRVHSSKAGLGAAQPQSARLNLFCSKAPQLPQDSTSAETTSLLLSLHALQIPLMCLCQEPFDQMPFLVR